MSLAPLELLGQSRSFSLVTTFYVEILSILLSQSRQSFSNGSEEGMLRLELFVLVSTIASSTRTALVAVTDVSTGMEWRCPGTIL